MRRTKGFLVTVALLCASTPPPAFGFEDCIEAYGTTVPLQIIVGQLTLGDMWLWNNMWGIRGHAIDNFKQCLFTDGDEFGWTWIKGTTDPVCSAPGGPPCPAPACMYQFTFGSLNYGVDPWGNDTGAADMPVNVRDLQSFVGTHDITYVATDDAPGSPGPIYARHALVYDLFLTTEEPEAGQDHSQSITDEVIIMMHYNPEYPDIEACSSTMSDPIEASAVFDGFYHYDYHSFDDGNSIGQNYHQFRRVGGDVAGAPVPANLDMVPFFQYLKQRYDQPDLWLGQVVIGEQLYDHTHGSVTFNSTPTGLPTARSRRDQGGSTFDSGESR
jgi:hypothetical protein